MNVIELVEKARRLDAAATPGPWAVHRCQGHGAHVAGDGWVVAACTSREREQCYHDAEFVSESRMLLPTLANELEALDAQLTSVQRTNETLAKDLAEAVEQLESASKGFDYMTRTLAEALIEADETPETHADKLAQQAAAFIEAANATHDDEEEAHQVTLALLGAAKARLGPLDALSEGDREAMRLWLQHAAQHGPESIQRGAATLLKIIG